MISGLCKNSLPLIGVMAFRIACEAPKAILVFDSNITPVSDVNNFIIATATSSDLAT